MTMLRTACLLFVALGAGGCAISAPHAVMAAAGRPDEGVSGTFRLTVQASGQQDGLLFLNSEQDYRDQRNVSLALTPPVVAILALRYHGDPATCLAGKRLHVTGTAKRVRIRFIADGKATEKYYYQTHILVRDPDQIRIIG